MLLFPLQFCLVAFCANIGYVLAQTPIGRCDPVPSNSSVLCLNGGSLIQDAKNRSTGICVKSTPVIDILSLSRACEGNYHLAAVKDLKKFSNLGKCSGVADAARIIDGIIVSQNKYVTFSGNRTISENIDPGKEFPEKSSTKKYFITYTGDKNGGFYGVQKSLNDSTITADQASKTVAALCFGTTIRSEWGPWSPQSTCSSPPNGICGGNNLFKTRKRTCFPPPAVCPPSVPSGNKTYIINVTTQPSFVEIEEDYTNCPIIKCIAIIFGGLDGRRSLLNSAESFSPDNQGCHAAISLPLGMEISEPNQLITRINGRLIICNLRTKARCYVMVGPNKVKMSDSVKNHRGFPWLVANDRLLILGTKPELFDPLTLTWTEWEAPEKIIHGGVSCAVIVGSQEIFLFSIGLIQKYDLTSRAWTIVSNEGLESDPQPNGCIPLPNDPGKKIFISQGKFGASIYNPKKNSFTRYRGDISGAAVVEIDSVIYAIGGPTTRPKVFKVSKNGTIQGLVDVKNGDRLSAVRINGTAIVASINDELLGDECNRI